MAEIEHIIRKFNKSRRIKHPMTLCYAPELSLNFEQTGLITACCFNRSYALGRYPANAIMDAWTGEPIKELRKVLRNNSLESGCGQCEKALRTGNFESVLISHFDDFVNYADKEESFMPAVFEFELSNTCNLECIMCGGHWSSAIRKNREGLPSIKSPYDDTFVSQVREFLPTLQRANFLGGEPFLISIYYDIWEDIALLNPDMDVAITTNGTVLSKRAKRIIQSLSNIKISASIDSIHKPTYESIRKNADFDIVWENLQFLLSENKLVSFSVCPIIQNRLEIPDIVAYCQERDIDIFFNIVHGPLGGRINEIHTNPNGKEIQPIGQEEPLPETSMQYLSSALLQETITLYKRSRFNGKYQVALDGLINQLITWRDAGSLTGEEVPMKRDYEIMKQEILDEISFSDHWTEVQDKILDVEARVNHEQGDAYQYYRYIYAMPINSIVETYRQNGSAELYRMFATHDQ